MTDERCPTCDVELVEPVNGDPLEPAEPYCRSCGWLRGEPTAEELIESLDEETVLRVEFKAHTDQFVYRFPSGIMVTVWGDRSISDGKLGVMSEEHVLDVLTSGDGVDPIETIPFEESPYAEGWVSEGEKRRREQDQ